MMLYRTGLSFPLHVIQFRCKFGVLVEVSGLMVHIYVFNGKSMI
jgi:hypothetical protein